MRIGLGKCSLKLLQYTLPLLYQGRPRRWIEVWVIQKIDKEAAKLSLDNMQEPLMNDPEVLFPAAVAEDSLPKDVPNPLQDLLEKIEKLKEEMERLFEKMNPASNQNRFRRSKQRNYIGLNPDTSALLFGYKGPIRTRSRYA